MDIIVQDPPISDFRTALFDWMGQAGVAHIAASFDGCGDSGQVDEINCSDASRQPTLNVPDLQTVMVSVRYKQQRYDTEQRKFMDFDMETISVSALIEELVYHFLELEWDGWEINEGSYGDVRFELATTKIVIDISQRYIATEDYTKEF